MELWITLTEDERKVLLQEVATKEGILEQAVEKDWYVSATLKALSLTQWGQEGRLLFKGGTSLSKGWNIISRFSEDVDLAVKRSFFFDKKENPFPEETKDQRKEIRKAVFHEIEDVLLPDLQEQFNALGIAGCVMEMPSKNSSHAVAVIEIKYTSVLEKEKRVNYIAEFVKLEFSAMSLDDPYEERSINSLISKHFEPIDSELECDFPTILPTRTFLEKMFLLHEEPYTKAKRIEKMSRHLYDLMKLMDVGYAEAALSDVELYRTVVAHREKFNNQDGVDYNTLHPSTVDCSPADDKLDEWKKDYDLLYKNHLYGDKPSFEEVITRVRQLVGRLRRMDIGPEPLFPEQSNQQYPEK